jgi:sugar phosphate isomerase/epimerase
MKIGICSFAFHRTVAAGSMDFAGYATACRELGCTQLDPWNAHLADPQGHDTLHAGRNPNDARLGLPSPERIERIAAEGAAARLRFGCVAVDGAHVIEADPAAERDNRERARCWIAIAARLGADSVRIDAGGPESLDASLLARIAAGYRELIDLAGSHRLRVLMENHWGPSQIPANVERILEACPGLGLLFDTHNWKPGMQREGWDRCAKHAQVVHVKTFAIGEDGEETTVDLAPAFARLREAGFSGTWSVESVPKDGDELAGARKTIALIRRRAGASSSARA